MNEKRVRLVVRYQGHVQGVGFRMTTVSQSTGLAVHGYVRNEHDGSVLMDVEGSDRDVKELMARIASAMEGRIDATDVDPRPPKGVEGGFHIEY